VAKLTEKLVLGTVQFGLPYGINNSTGQPTKENSLAMLDFAYSKGIKIFDTAFAYGDAEKILGEFCRSRGLSGKVKIITKIKAEIASAPDEIKKDIFGQFAQSLERLKTGQIDGCLLHEPEQIRDAGIVNVLQELKEQGLVKNIGVSIYDEADAIYAVGLKEIDYIQIPYNIFDQRLDQTDFFRLAGQNKKTVFARSVFLQGLLLMPKDRIPPHLAGAKAYLKVLDEIINKYSLTRMQAALAFALINDGIDHVVFGVDNTDQLVEIINLAAQAAGHDDCVKELKNKFIGIEKYIISPNLWKK